MIRKLTLINGYHLINSDAEGRSSEIATEYWKIHFKRIAKSH